MTDRLPDTGPSTSPSAYSPDFLLELYRTIYTIRLFEHRGIELYRAGLIRGYFYTYLGGEAVAIGRVVDAHPGVVAGRTAIGGQRAIDMPTGELLPRIC